MMAAAEAAVNGPPLYPGTHGGNLPSQPPRGMENSVPQDPAAPSQPQQAPFSRPVFYLPTPPPPPLLQYQWPMPFSYNPFAGFPGMGYGMVMPPFPPPPFMEAPPYILPHSHMQPVDYRRYPNAPGAPHQNPVPRRRAPTPATSIPVKETVNTEVQTEPLQRAEGGYIEAYSDSGRGTASNSPSSMSSSSQKQGSTSNSTSGDATRSQDSHPCPGNRVKQSSTGLYDTGKKAVQSFLKATQETQTTKDGVIKEPPIVSAFHSSRFNMWSEGSPDGLVPVCCSSQTEDEVAKERRISVPDILMLQMADKASPQDDRQLTNHETDEQHEKSDQSFSESKNGKASAGCSTDNEGIPRTDSAVMHRIPGPLSTPLKELPESKKDPEEMGGSVRCCLTYKDDVLHSLNATQNPPENEEEKTNLYDDTTELVPYMSSSSFQMRRKMNESIWSVESLEAFVPNREWLLQNGIFEAEVIIETEETDDGISTRNDNLFVKAKEIEQTLRCFSNTVGFSESKHVFSTPSERERSPKRQRVESETVLETNAAEKGQSISVTIPSTPATVQRKSVVPCMENLEEQTVSKEDLTQGILRVPELEEPSRGTGEEEMFLLSSVAEKMLSTVQMNLQDGNLAEESVGQECKQTRKELTVPVAAPKLAEVSPSKLPSVDAGIQCVGLCKCESLSNCTERTHVHPIEIPDMRKANHMTTELNPKDGRHHKYTKRGNSGRNRNQDRYSSQDEAIGYSGKHGRLKGGTGRNLHY